MDHVFPVTVLDDAGGAVAGARVCLVTKAALGAEHHPYPSLAASHSDAGGGKYTEAAPIAAADGDWVLVVTLAGKSPVVQPLKFKKGADGAFAATPRPSVVATVTITGVVRSVAGVKVKELAFHVKLFKASELVFIAGVDYNRRDISGGWQFHEYGFNRAEALRRGKKLDHGTVVTVFSTAKISRTTRVWGGKSWVDVEVAQLGDPSTRVLPAAGNAYQPVAGLDIHITDFYKYLARVGGRAPHGVREIGIFSHSWPGGPILYNTGESALHRGPTDARDPDDFDARRKDFNAVNFAAYSKMTDAFAPGCRFTIWGCSATTHFKFRSRQALKAIQSGVAEDDFFTVRSEAEDHDPAVGVFAVKEEHTSELRHRWVMDTLFRQSTYPAEAAKKLGIEVRSGCPGTGSDPTTVEGIEMLMVDLGGYHDVFEYFHKKFAPEFAETNGKWDRGYVDYRALQSRAVVAKPSFSTAYYDLDIQTKVTRWQPASGAQMRFWNGKSLAHPTPNVQVVFKLVPNLVTPGKTGHLFVLKDRDPTMSQAVYVQEDQRIFKITQDAANDWRITGPEL